MLRFSCIDIKYLFNIILKIKFLGIVHGSIILFICYNTHDRGVPNISGRSDDLWVFGINLFTCVMIVCSMNLGLNTNYWNYYLIMAYVIGIVVYILLAEIMNYIYFLPTYKT